MFRHLAIVLVIISTTNFVWAQERWLYPPAVFEPEDVTALTEVRRLTNLHKHEAARDICLRLADENTGTSLGAMALEGAEMAELFNENLAGAQQIRQRIIAEYPGSRFEVRARFSDISELELNSDPEGKLTAYSGFLEDRGAPRLEGILAGQNLEQAAVQMQSFHPEIRYELAAIYALSNSQVEDHEQAFNLAKFGRMAFGTVYIANTSFAASLKGALQAWRGKELGGEPSRPTIVVVSPAPNSTVGTQPAISFRLSSGDYRKAQVDLAQMSFTLDGIDQELNASVNIDIDDTLSENLDFEVLTVSLSPTLSVGPHTIEVTAHTGFGPATPENSATATWSFTVTDAPPDPTSTTLPTTQDSTLVQRNQHENEGANPLLTLEKVQGKATRSAVGFDLDGVNLNGLTSAKLVLTVDPSESVTGWGNGETVTVSAITTPWVEGNGRHFGLNNSQQNDGSGSGTTWFAAVDTNIDNNSSNSASSWNGASVATLNPTAPALVVTNHFDGQLEFDVTNDILNRNGYEGWLVTKDRENKGSKVSFYSKEGATAAGNPDLAPRLVLDFGDSVAKVNEAPADGVLAKLGFGRGKLESRPTGSELPSFRERLQESPVGAYAGETLVGAMAGPNPALKMASKVAYRTWLEQGLG